MAVPPRPPKLKQNVEDNAGVMEVPYGLYAKPHRSRDMSGEMRGPQQLTLKHGRRVQNCTVRDKTVIPGESVSHICGDSSLHILPVDRSNKPDSKLYDEPRSRVPHHTSATSAPQSETDSNLYDVPRSRVPRHTSATSAPQSETGMETSRTGGRDSESVASGAAKPLAMTHSAKIDGDQIKVVLELKSPEIGDAPFSRVPMRLVCLFDVSGSMGQQFGAKSNRRRDTKLVKMRNVAKILAHTLDEKDYLGVIAFGHDTEVLSPLTKNEPRAKRLVLNKVGELGRNGLSLTTNLSRALLAAIDMFREDSRRRNWKCFDTRDVIVVLTDGDVNDGITDGQELVRQVRQAIRELETEGSHYNKEPSLTISTVITGNNVTEAVYLLSKTCGSDAFYYIEKDTDTLEIGALMPVLLRMTSVASSISVQAAVLDPAELLPQLCSHEYMAHRPHERDDEIWYFLHDVGLGMSKHLLIALDKESVLCETNPDAVVLRVKVEYRDAMMEKRSFTHEVTRGEFGGAQSQQSLLVSIQDIRRISQLALRQVADDVKAEKKERAVAGLLQSIEEVDEQVQQHCTSLGAISERQVFTDFVQSVTTNLANLLTVIEDSQKTTGNKWSAVKALSSAIVREAPSAPKLLSQETHLKKSEPPSAEVLKLRSDIRDQYKRTGVKSTIFFDFDLAMGELADTLKPNRRPPYFSVEPSTEDKVHPAANSDDDDDYFYSGWK